MLRRFTLAGLTMLTVGTIIVLLLDMTAPVGVAGEPAQIILRQTMLGPMPTDQRAWSIAPDAGRVALAANSGSRQQVFIDGNASALYGNIAILGSFGAGMAPRLLMISPDDKLVAFAAQKSPGEVVMVMNNKEGPPFDRIGSARFSATGHHFVYTASKQSAERGGGHTFVVFDGKLSPGYRTVLTNNLRLTNDGEHVAYAAQADDQKWHAIIDGKEGPAYANVADIWLARNGRVAYVAHVSPDPKDLYDNHMVIDGKVGPKYAVIQPAIFSADGGHVAYVGQSEERDKFGGFPQFAVIDGKASPPLARADLVTLSPDGKHSAYRAAENTGRAQVTYAIVDGQKSADYDSVLRFLYSADSKHLAYIAQKNGANGQKYIVVLDGQEQTPIEQIDQQTLTFSPDGQQLGYTAREGSYGFAVIDNKRGPNCGAIEPRTFAWSPALDTFTYKTRGSTSDYSVWIGTEAPPKEGAPADLAITPDGKHRAQVFRPQPGSNGEGMKVVLDGKPVGTDYGTVDQLQLTPDGAHVAFLAGGSPAEGKKGQFVVHDGRGGQTFFRIGKVVLSPDGQHVAYDGWDDGSKAHVVVDSIVGPTYQDVPLGFTNQKEALQFRPDGSLVFLAVIDGKMNRMVYPVDSLAAMPKTPSPGAAASAPGYSPLYTFGKFPMKEGTHPQFVAVAPDGSIYAATSGGGKYQHGALCRMKADGSDFTVIHNFAGGRSDGNNPMSLMVGPDGAAYGSLMDQGPTGAGLIYRCATGDSDYKIVHAFDSNKEGATPVICAIDPDGTIYGVVGRVSPFPIFRMKSDGSDVTLIYKVKPAQGIPDTTGSGPFTDGGDGFFYGVNRDSIFKIKKDGSGHALVRPFGGNPVDINSTEHPPIVGPDGALYGFATNGGPNNTGVVFRLNKDGSDYKIILNPEGEQFQPHAIAFGAGAKLYVMARPGIVRANLDGTGMEVVEKMDGGPFRSSVVTRNGALYGVAQQGGQHDGGIVFRYGFGSAAGGQSDAPTVVVQNVPPAPLDSTGP